MNLIKHEYTCPFCDKDYYTYVEKEKLIDVYERSKLKQEIFPNYNLTYVQLFIENICPICQQKKYGPDSDTKVFSVSVSASQSEDDKMRSDIIEMIDNAKRA